LFASFENVLLKTPFDGQAQIDCYGLRKLHRFDYKGKVGEVMFLT